LETVHPFRAWRYGPVAGDLTDLIAPPYDVIGPELRSRLYARSRFNIVRVDLGMTTPSDNDCDDQYTRAAAQLAQWKENGVLVRDTEPSVTFVEESFTGPDGRTGVRHGFLALIELREFDEGVVFPHEQTLTGPKEDRYRLMTATDMSLSPIFLLYDLPGDEITTAWKTSLGSQTPTATVAADEGTATKLWPTSDHGLLVTVGQNLAAARFIIADGHHRYETALRYRKDRRAMGGENGDSSTKADDRGSRVQPLAYDYALAYFANIADPGLAIYATHRLIAGVDPEIVAALPRLLEPTFIVERLAVPSATSAAAAAQVTSGAPTMTAAAAAARSSISAFLRAYPRAAFGLWGPGLEGAYGLRLADREAAQAATPGHSPAYQELDVTILQNLVLDRVLGISPGDIAAETNVTFTKEPADAFARLGASEFQAGFFMNPTGLDQIRQVALGGERMPQKATFFYPKVPTGLAFHDLTGRI
jgi:uncharacterized protein (DUF1015 family)